MSCCMVAIYCGNAREGRGGDGGEVVGKGEKGREKGEEVGHVVGARSASAENKGKGGEWFGVCHSV